jgi:hypothetical protein
MACQAVISGADVEITCYMNRYDDSLLSTAYQRSLHAAKACVAIVSFESSVGLDILITEFMDPSGTRYPMAFRSEAVTGLCKSFSLPADFIEITELVLKDTLLFLALIDLNDSLTHSDTALLCARAIERLRHAVAGKDASPDIGWPKVHRALRVDQKYLQFITAHSHAPRHGARFNHTPDITKEVSKRSWIVMDRFITYRRRGSVALWEDEFPLLKG